MYLYHYETDKQNQNTNLIETLNNIADEMQMYQSFLNVYLLVI